ncbi:hypothetical protein ACWDSE_30250, partial [Micromonospora chersina]
MPVTHPAAGTRSRPPLPDLAVSLAGALFVLAGAAGLVPGPAAVALAVAGGCALACVRLGHYMNLTAGAVFLVTGILM